MGSHGIVNVLTIVGQGLVGTLVALKAERRGQSFRIIDEGSGSTASRAAAGLYNPLTGPRFTPSEVNWVKMIEFYLNLEQDLGVPLVHPLVLQRPTQGSKMRKNAFPQGAPGWSAELCPQNTTTEHPWVEIKGGGWIDISVLLDVTRERWLRAGVLEARHFRPEEGQSQNVLWCCGPAGLFAPQWSQVPGVKGVGQAVRGDVITVKIPGLSLEKGQIDKRFLLPLGEDRFRWGATHEMDVTAMDYRESARKLLEKELQETIGPLNYEVIDHRWGVRPASRTGSPLWIRHTDQPGWSFLNGFGGRGVTLLPAFLDRLDI